MKNINMDTIVLDPSPILRETNELVEFPMSKEDTDTLMNMYQYVLDSQDEEKAEALNLQPAVGIAAPQIGVNKKMCAIVVHDLDKEGNEISYHYALVNPKIMMHSVKQCALGGGEACLSIREVHEGIVPRHLRIKIKAYDLLTKKDIEINAKEYLAIVLQHELDHLDGILFYDHIDKENPLYRDPSIKIIE